MEEGLVCCHFEDSPGGFCPAENRLPSSTLVSTRAVPLTRSECGWPGTRNQARLGVHDEVMEAVDAFVPGSIRYKKGMRTLNHDVARSISAADGHRTLSHALAPLPGLTPILIWPSVAICGQALGSGATLSRPRLCGRGRGSASGPFSTPMVSHFFETVRNRTKGLRVR
jgi:hypothetical protein